MTLSPPTILPEAFFLPTQNGPCFCLFHRPQGVQRRGSVLYLHPFAEELNTTRRIVAHQARNLAQLGYGVLQIDLFGCGDSAGEFEDIKWSAWLQTAQAAHLWFQENNSGPFWIWGLRAGALLAAALANQLQGETQEKVNLLLWQPVTDGRQMLQQLLRLSQAGAWMGTRTADPLSASQMLAQGKAIEIAGYTISPELLQDFAQVRLLPDSLATGGRLVWIEVSSHSTPMLGPASEKSLSHWMAAGWKTDAEVVTGTAFWQNINTSDAHALWLATQRAMAQQHE